MKKKKKYKKPEVIKISVDYKELVRNVSGCGELSRICACVEYEPCGTL